MVVALLARRIARVQSSTFFRSSCNLHGSKVAKWTSGGMVFPEHFVTNERSCPFRLWNRWLAETPLRRLRAQRVPIPSMIEPSTTKTRIDFGKLELPYEHGEEDMDAYVRKTSLSPWVPVPDVVARKVMDLCEVGPGDIHVDLGSGDGRVCFQAFHYGVAHTTGIDVDEKIIDVARQRLAKRHPQPDNVEFIVADLMDVGNEVWQRYIQKATIITMFFASEGLRAIRPLLETKMAGKKCTIVTCGYDMPGWKPFTRDAVLGTKINVYKWGNPVDDDEDDDLYFVGPDVLENKPKGLFPKPRATFQGVEVIDETDKYCVPGFDPEFMEEEFLSDSDWEKDDDEDDDIGEEGAPVPADRKHSSCANRKQPNATS